MGYQSKTYSLSDDVVEAIERARAGGTSPNRFLRALMGLDENGADGVPEPVQSGSNEVPAPRESVSPALLPAADAFEESIPDRRPKNCQCRHCPKRFAGPRNASICPDCKRAGHTLTPAECPKCNEGNSI